MPKLRSVVLSKGVGESVENPLVIMEDEDVNLPGFAADDAVTVTEVRHLRDSEGFVVFGHCDDGVMRRAVTHDPEPDDAEKRKMWLKALIAAADPRLRGTINDHL